MKKISARGVVIKDNKVLLIYRKHNGKIHYSIPGGKVEPDETLEECATREIMEESSITTKPLQYLGKFEHENKDKEQHLFLCQYLEGEPQLGDSVEKEKMKNDINNYFEPKWVDLNTVEQLEIKPDPCSEFFIRYIKQYNHN